MSTQPTPNDEELFQYLAGEVPAERKLELETWAATSPGKERVAELRALTDLLEVAPPQLDLVAAIDAKLTKRRRRRWGMSTIGLLAAASALVLFFRPTEDEVRIKGSHPATWSGVELYRLQQDRAPERLEAIFAAKDSLLVAYVNGGERPFSHLALFAVSASGKIYWYYPAWLEERDDPQSIAIEVTTKPIELKERITQDLPSGRVVFHALFSRQPLRVSELELAVSQAKDPLGPLPLPGSSEIVQQRQIVEVP